MSLYSWGSDIYGRLGHNTEDKHLAVPSEIKSLARIRLRQVTCGSAHNIVIDSKGTCYTWGKCHFGQLGHGEHDKDEHSPLLVEALKGIPVRSVVGGDSHVLAITEQGCVYSWGLGYYGTLGHGDEVSFAIPKLIESLSGVIQGAAGTNHNLVLTNDGSVYVWGRDHYGQLDLPTKSITISPGVEKTVRLTQKVPLLKAINGCVKSLSACFNHTLILLTSGQLISFGFNEHGELGRKTNAKDEPIIDPDHFKEPVIYVTAGWKHCAAITTSGSLYTWGHGSYGRLGTGSNQDTPRPTLVQGLPPCSDVSCGESHTIALDTTGRLWAWGSAHYGKLGLPLDDCSFIQLPRMLPFKSSVKLTAVCCGTNHSLAYTCD